MTEATRRRITEAEAVPAGRRTVAFGVPNYHARCSEPVMSRRFPAFARRHNVLVGRQRSGGHTRRRVLRLFDGVSGAA